MRIFSRGASVIAGITLVLLGANVSTPPATASGSDPNVATVQVTRLVFQPQYSTNFADPVCGNNPVWRTPNGCVVAGAQQSYSSVAFVNLDGTGLTTMRIDCTSPPNANWQAPWEGVDRLAVDQARNRIIWENSFEPGLSSVDSDGTDCGLIGQGGYYGTKRVAIESGSNFLYSANNTTVRRFPATAGSSPASETGTNLTLTGLGSFAFNAVNDMAVANGKLYMAVNATSGGTGAIIEVTLDTSATNQAARVLVQGEAAVNNVQVDATNGHIYWGTGLAVRRASLSNGTGITTIANGSFDWAVPVPSESRIVAGQLGTADPTLMNMSGTTLGTLAIDAQSIPVPIVFTLTAQTVTWTPSTNLDVSNSPATPSALASSSGPGGIQYSITNAGTTGCSVNQSTGVLTFTSVGTCVVRATAAASGSYGTGYADVSFVITDQTATTTTTAPTTVAPTSTLPPGAGSQAGGGVSSTTVAGSGSSVTSTPALPTTGAESSHGSDTATTMLIVGFVLLIFGFRRRLQPES